MKGVKIGLKEGIIILLAFAYITSFLGIWITSILLFIGLAYNTYLLNKEGKKKVDVQSDQQKKDGVS